MSTTLLSAVTAAVLAATCLAAFADPPKKHNRTGTVSESSYLPSTNSAPAVKHNGTADNANGHIQALGRNGSHSMHPNAPVAAEQFADDEVEAYRQIGDDYPNAPGSN